MGKTLGLLVLLLLTVGASTAAAQPGNTVPRPPPPYGYPQPAQVTPEEYKLLVRGEYSEGQHVGGGLLATFIGVGTGHMAQGRWMEKGWIFTVGEVAAYGVLLASVLDCIDIHQDEDDCDENTGLIVGSALAFAGFRIWEIVDAWAHPPAHNRRVRELRARVYGPQYYHGAPPAPPMPPPVYLRAVDGGYTGGITLRF